MAHMDEYETQGTGKPPLCIDQCFQLYFRHMCCVMPDAYTFINNIGRRAYQFIGGGGGARGVLIIYVGGGGQSNPRLIPKNFF